MSDVCSWSIQHRHTNDPTNTTSTATFHLVNAPMDTIEGSDLIASELNDKCIANLPTLRKLVSLQVSTSIGISSKKHKTYRIYIEGVLSLIDRQPETLSQVNISLKFICIQHYIISQLQFFMILE